MHHPTHHHHTSLSIMALIVFETPELLEAILLDLGAQDREGLKTLLLSQRVCKTFEATIKDSSKLQETLFFKQEQMRDVPPDAGFQHLRLNALLFDHGYMSEAELDKFRPKFGPGKSVFQPDEGSYSVSVCSTHDYSRPRLSLRDHINLEVRLHRQNGDPIMPFETVNSWQKMLLVQSSQALPMWISFRLIPTYGYSLSSEEIKVGETVGDLFKRFWPHQRRTKIWGY
ncbi:hypothetical protein LTR15_006600 [Elasticomyces elasticus]|nr:hypothetical protein LTR15_006600 [Elasticomyces elasticus]